MKKFSARIFIISRINPVVDVPDEVLAHLFVKAGRNKGPIPVKGKLNGKTFVQTVVKYGGAWRLYLNGPMRAAAGIDAGDIANVEIDFDPAPRTLAIDPALETALAKNKAAKTEYEKLAPYRQKEINRYLGSMKTEASHTKNVEKILRHLTGEKTDTLHALMRVNKD